MYKFATCPRPLHAQVQDVMHLKPYILKKAFVNGKPRIHNAPRPD